MGEEMTAEEIRSLNHDCQKEINETKSDKEHRFGIDSLNVSMITEVAAQLAELNEKLKIILNPPLGYDTSKIDPEQWIQWSDSQGIITVNEPRATLRDKFAMAAMTGLLADPTSSGPEGCATAAYKYADAMLEQRTK